MASIVAKAMKGNIVSAVALGVGVSVLAPIVIPTLAAVAKPLAKGAVKGSLLIFEKSKEMGAEVKEAMEDLVAEAKAEMNEPQQAAIAAGGAKAKKGQKDA